MDILVFWVLLVGKFRLDSEGVRTKVISLGLEQVSGEILGTITIEPAESSAEGWGWYAEKCGFRDDISPAGLCLVNSLVEEIIEEEILKVWVVAVCRSDIF